MLDLDPNTMLLFNIRTYKRKKNVATFDTLERCSFYLFRSGIDDVKHTKSTTHDSIIWYSYCEDRYVFHILLQFITPSLSTVVKEMTL